MKQGAGQISNSVVNAPIFAGQYIDQSPLEGAFWYAVYTRPRTEKAVAQRLMEREIEAFLPLYQAVHLWKNRQRAAVSLPLFPGYVFVRSKPRHNISVLAIPGIIHVVGSGSRATIPDAEINLLRMGIQSAARVEPYHGLVTGTRVRIKSGVMQGVEGVLARKQQSLRFILTISMINQSAALEVDADLLEPVSCH